MEDKIIINQVNPETFEFQDYSISDESLIVSNDLDTVFSGSTDYIEAYVYDENQNQISSQVPFTNYKVTEGDVVLTPSNDLERLGFDVGSYYISYDFYRPKLASTLNTQYYISEISSDRTEIRLDSTQIDNALLISSSLEFIAYRDTAEYFVDFLLNFGNNQLVIANNIELDLKDEGNPTILIKLYEALPAIFDQKSQCSVVEQISTPQSYNVTFPPLAFTPDDFTYISGPNYSLNIKGQSGTPGMDFSYNTLVDSNLTSSFNQVNSLLNRKEIDINVNYEDYNDFVYFSSAYTRLQNFYYKVGLIQSASAQLGQITSATTGSKIYSSSQAEFSSVIEDTIKNFDGYEYFLYFNSGSQDSYPKSNTEPPFTLYSTGSNEVLTWLGSTDTTDPYYGGQAVSSSDFDENNQNSLYYAIPEYLRSDIQNAKYELFVDMVGQHYDNLWMYTKNITTKFDADNRLDYGISKDMVADAIRDFGVKLYSNNFNTNDLYTTFLGLTPSGSSFPFPYMTGSIGGVVNTPSGYEYVDSTISASNDIVPLDDVNKRLYKRIYHNIPYLLKTKGTVAGLRALITSYGIPDTILRINEFGGKDRNNSQDWDLKQDIYNVGLNTTSSAFTSSFSLNSEWNAELNSPSSLQFRFKTNGIPSASTSPITQSFFETDFISRAAMVIEYNDSLLVEGNYSGSVPSKYKEYGTLKFWPNADTNPTNIASLYLPFWDGNWWSVQIDRDLSIGNNGGFILRAANKIGENLGFTGSDAISADTTKWENSNEIYWLPKNYISLAGENYFPFSGSLQEVRYYTEQLSESVFYDYAMNPYSFEGNGTNTAPDTLAFRLPLGTLLNTGSYSGSIHPKVTGSWVTTSSFDTHNTASFTSIPTWLNNVEDIHLDQTPSGMRNRVTDKIQTEALILPEGDTLSGYKSIQQTSYVSESFTPNVNYLEVAFSPQDQINDDIIGQMGYFNIGDYIGDPRLISSSDKSYPDLDILRDAYFEKYITNYNLTDFVRLIKFFDNSLFKMIEDFTPARTSLSSGVVIKQHLLERNRQRPAQVTSSFEQYSGSVRNLPKDYSLGEPDYPQYSDSGSAIYKFGGGTGGGFEPFNGLKTYPSGSENLGPNNEYFLTQSWDESWSTFSGSAPIDRTDQREFYNGEFSGSIDVGIKDICSAYFKISNTSYSYVPVFFSANGYSNTQVLTEQQFLSPQYQPPATEVWFWHDQEKITYLKLSLITYNGLNITGFIQNVEFVTFSFNSAYDYQGNVLSGPQTFYLESIAIQPALPTEADSVGAALGFVVPELSSTAISSDDGAFYNFNFSSSGNFQWYATQNVSLDPSPLLDTGISESVPQGYFPLTYHTESFFRGWASSNFYTNGTYNSYDGVLDDALNNFNTGSHEIDNTDTTVQSGIDPASNVPWFMNASNPQGSGKSWLQIPSESFLDYANIPDSSVGPTSTNNYFNIAWTSASSVEPHAVQGTNYFYNASNNTIYMSGSEFQNELKYLQPLYTSSLVSQIINSSGTTPSPYTPIGQSTLTIPIDLSRGQELWVYQGENDENPYQGNTFVGYDKNAWRYNRYIHRPYKVYYVTETGSGQPGIPYSLYDPMTVYNGSGTLDTVPPYYNGLNQNFATMLGTTGDATIRPNRPNNYWRPLNYTETMPSVEAVSGSFQVFSEDRQVRPFLFTTYRTLKFLIPTPDTPARGSGSAISISQSDGTPFATLRMYQNQTPSTVEEQYGTAYRLECNQVNPCTAFYYNENNTIAIVNISGGSVTVICGAESRNTTTVILSSASTGNIGVSTSLGSLSNPCPSTTNSSGFDNIVNESPFFYKNPRPPGVTVGDNFGSYNIAWGELNNGENTSSFSLQTGTQPGGNDENYEIVFPEGSYIFTMSDFDTGRFSNGRTEFGLYTTYGDYVSYNFENQNGSGANPVTIDYIDANYDDTSIDVYEYAVQDADGEFDIYSNQNGGGTNSSDVRGFTDTFRRPFSPQYQRINIEADGDYNMQVYRSYVNGQLNIRVYRVDNQTETGANIGTAQELFETAPQSVPNPQNIASSLTGLLAGQQLLIKFYNDQSGGLIDPNRTFRAYDIYNKSLANPNGVVAVIGSPEPQTPFNDPFVITGSINDRYETGVEVPGAFATKVVDAYILYSSSLSSSLDGSYIFGATPTFGTLSVTASVVVSSFTDAGAALYGNAIYGVDEYGGGASGGGTTWTTASIILYTGSSNNFPNNMPELGGNVFAITSSYSLTHHQGERITLHAELTPSDLQFGDVIKMALRVGSGSDDPSVVENGLIVTQYSMSFSSSTPTEIDPSIPTVFDNDNNFALALDCQPLLNNYSDSRINGWLMDVDYNTDLVTPSNWQQIIDYSASKASVPESNYTILASSRPRYFGVRGFQEIQNEWTPGDSGTYGKLPIIEVSRGFLAYFNKTNDLYPLLNNTTQYNIQYLIGQDGTATQPKLSDTTLYNIQGTFDSYPLISRGTVSLNTEDNSILKSLNGLVEFKKVTQRPTPIVYTQQSGLFPNYTYIEGINDEGNPTGIIAYTGSGLDLIGNEPVDASITPNFANYSVLAEDTSTAIAGTDYALEVFKSTNKNPPTNLSPNVTASFGSPSIDVYDTATGILTIPNDDGYPSPANAGDNNPTSQQYELTMEMGVDTTPLTYEIQSSNPGKGGGYNTTPNVGSMLIRFQRTTSGGPTNNSFSNFRPNNIQVKVINYIRQANGDTITYESDITNVNWVNKTTSGVSFNYNTNTIKGLLPSSYQTAVQNSGPLLKQRWVVTGTVPSSYIKQGRRFRIQSSGDLITPNASQRNLTLDPKFFPDDQDGRFSYKIDLQGKDSNPVTSAVPPYWVFKDSANEVGNATLYAGTGYSLASNVATSVDSGPGELATVNITQVEDTSAINTSISAVGADYSDATGLSTTVSPPGGTGLEVDITVDDSSTLNTSPLAQGSGYTQTPNLPTTVSPPGGSGATVTITSIVAGTGEVTGYSIASAGSGYTAGDVLTIVQASSTSDATITIDSISGTGAVLTAIVSSNGTGYSATDVLTITQLSSTVDATLDIDSITGTGAILAYNFDNRGTDYSVDDVLTIAGGDTNATLTVLSTSAGGNIVATKLIMSSSQMNKGYGRGFIQKDLTYTSSLNKDFPEGIEPGYATFPTIETPWSLEPYDEIRFNNDENNVYKILSIVSPAEQIDSRYIIDGVGSLEITLDRPVPQSFTNIKQGASAGQGVAMDVFATSSTAVSVSDVLIEPESKSTPQLVKIDYPVQNFRPLDFFVIRRYVDDASSLITLQQFPYTNPPTTGSASGFMLPQYPASKLKIDPDEILSDLIDKKLIE